MIWLFTEIWVWLLLAFIIGWFAHWFFCCRNKDDEITSAESTITSSDLASNAAPAAPAIQDNWKPQGFASRPDDADDLKRVKGIGSVIEETLNDLGIYQFKQIGNWDDNNVSWVENFLSFPGRIGREDWIKQAQTLHDGGTTEFAKRVDKGDVNY